MFGHIDSHTHACIKNNDLYARACIHTHTHTHIYTRTNAHIHTQTHLHNTHTHTHTHTHTKRTHKTHTRTHTTNTHNQSEQGSVKGDGPSHLTPEDAAHLLYMPHSLHTGPTPKRAEGRALPSKPYFRYWIDFQVLNSPSSAALLERAFQKCVPDCTCACLGLAHFYGVRVISRHRSFSPHCGRVFNHWILVMRVKTMTRMEFIAYRGLRQSCSYN